MANIETQLKRITEKLQLLIRQNQSLLKDNERLEKEVTDLRLKAMEDTKKVEEIEQKLSLMKMANGQMADKDKAEMEKRINQYVREINRCINVLSD